MACSLCPERCESPVDVETPFVDLFRDGRFSKKGGGEQKLSLSYLSRGGCRDGVVRIPEKTPSFFFSLSLSRILFQPGRTNILIPTALLRARNCTYFVVPDCRRVLLSCEQMRSKDK